MRFNIPTAILAFAGIASGFIIPTDLPYGSYSVSVDDNGNSNFTIIEMDDAQPITNVHSAKSMKRAVSFPGNPAPFCQQSVWFHSDAFWGSNRDGFASLCARRGSQSVVGKGLSIFNYAGDGVAFMCSYAQSGSPCVPDEWYTAVDKMYSGCGRNADTMQPAFLSIPSWFKSYGYAQKDAKFC